MKLRIFNFSAGPAVLPEPVLDEARENLLSLGDTGIGILEHSHRSKAFLAVYEEAIALCREVASIPGNYHVLFLQGGASSQFYMVPMNLLSQDATADFLNTGAWSKKAIAEAKRFGNAHVACSSDDRNFCYIPKSCEFSENPAYVHYTSNNTIFGTQHANVPEIPDGTTLVCDMSSDILSRPIDVSKFGIIYAGAQKNLGPSGVTLVLIRDDVAEMGPDTIPTMLQYRTQVKNDSAFNTPPTFPIYVIGLVLKWLKGLGGLAAIEEQNRRKSEKLYSFIDKSNLFTATADEDSRSLMNVTFVTGDADLDAKFIQTAKDAGLDGLKGHRSVGGMRASLYNAFPAEGVDVLVELMEQFEHENT